MAFKQSTVVSSEYSIYDANNSKWVSYSLRTNATDIVLNSANRLFIQNDSHTINGKKFYSVSGSTYTAQSITLYSTDIKIRSNDNTTVYESLSGLKTMISDINGKYASTTEVNNQINTLSNNISNTYLKLSGGTMTGDLRISNGGSGEGQHPYIVSDTNDGETIILLPTSTGDTVTLATDVVATNSSKGLMSNTDKSHLDSMWNLWSADGTNDTLVNKIEEVLTAFNNFPESSNIVTLLEAKQNKVSTLGSKTEPVYISSSGTFSTCSAYAGGTAVTLNGTSKAGNTASFYAPTTAGNSGQLLMSGGSSSKPEWVTPGYADKSADNTFVGINTFTSGIVLDSPTPITLLSDSSKLKYSVSGTTHTIASTSDIPTITVSTTAPSSPKAGDIWINTTA